MRWLGLAGPPLLAIVLALATNLASDTFPATFQKAAWPVLAALAVIAVGLELARQRATGRESDDERLRVAADALAGAVRQQWLREAGLRGLKEPWVLPQPWATTERPVSPPAAHVLGRDVPPPAERVPWWRRLSRRSRAIEPTDLTASGEVEELVRTVLDLPHRQVVVLGEPGGGKTVLAIQFTLALVARRAHERQLPVPVLLSVSSWRVGEEPLLDWIRNQLRRDYPELAVDLLDRLVDGPGLIVPVLDGMDELPRALHAEAIRQIDEAFLGRPLMLTCRSREYEDAVSRADRVLATAMVVELGPVGVEAAIAYLSAGRVDGDARWTPVFRHLRTTPTGPLATALRTPLMIGLARTVADPAELLTFDDWKRIEQCLLNRFVANVYPDAPHAETWLRSLATHLRHEDTYELAWWRLHRMRTSTTLITSVVAGLAGALLAATAVWLMVLPTVAGSDGAVSLGAVAGVVAGVATGWAVRARAVVEPSRVNTRVRGRRVRLAGQLSGGAVRGTAVGLLIGVIAEATYTVTFDAADPSRLGLVLGVIFGAVTGLAYGLAEWLQSPDDAVRAASPRATLRADRTAKLVQLAVFGTAFGLTVALVTGLVAGPPIAVIDGVGAGLLGVVVGLARGPHVWTTFLVARCTSAWRGELPWRLMSFLDDAHRRGVLRANGDTYQFRHGLLQDHLAGDALVAADVVESATPAAPRSRRRRAAVLAVVSLVAGIGLGVGLPVAGGLQTQCGVSPFNSDVRYLRVGLDSECVGVTDGSYEFSDDIAAVSRLIALENEHVRNLGAPYVRVALLAPLNRGPLSPTEIKHALEGVFVAQQRANLTNPVKAEVLLANTGSRQRHWAPVVDQLLRSSTEEHPLVSVIGLGTSTSDAQDAVQSLAARGIPMISAMANAVQGDGLLRITPVNTEFAFALYLVLSRYRIKPRYLVTYGDRRDTYVAALHDSLEVPWRGSTIEHFVETAAELRPVVTLLCQDPAPVLFSGRTDGLHELIRTIASSCPYVSITIATEAVDLEVLRESLDRTAVRVIYASPTDPAGWQDHRSPPDGFALFSTLYRDRFVDPLDDGFALLYHDAALTAFTAIGMASAAPTAASVREKLSQVRIIGATGTLTFDDKGNPIGKPIQVLDFRSGFSVDLDPYVTNGHG